jgi:hypothetical protein
MMMGTTLVACVSKLLVKCCVKPVEQLTQNVRYFPIDYIGFEVVAAVIVKITAFRIWCRVV